MKKDKEFKKIERELTEESALKYSLAFGMPKDAAKDNFKKIFKLMDLVEETLDKFEKIDFNKDPFNDTVQLKILIRLIIMDWYFDDYERDDEDAVNERIRNICMTFS